VIEVRDHYENGKHKDSNLILAKQIFMRIRTEHPDISPKSIKTDKYKLEMFIEGERFSGIVVDPSVQYRFR
jgi:hypothetical protein